MKPDKQGKNKGRPAPPVEHQFKPGQSGNPRGRPKGSLSLSTLLREALSENDGERAKRIIDAMITCAEKGDIRHIKELLDRIDGKVADNLNVEGGVSISFEIVEAVPPERG